MSTPETHFPDDQYWRHQHDTGDGTLDLEADVSTESLPRYGTTSFAVMAMFILYVIWWYLQGSYRFPALGNIRFEFILGGALSAVATLKILKSKDNVFPTLVSWALAFVMLMGVMTVVTIDPALSQTVFIDRVVKFLMMGVFIYAFVCSPLTLRWFLGAWLFAFAKMAQEGVVGWFGGGLVWENQGTMRLHGSTPNYSHPNSFSGTQLATLPFLYFLFPLASRLLKILIGAQIFGALLIVLTTGSRTGYVALAAGILILILKARSTIKTLLAFGLVIYMATPYIPQDYTERAETIYTQQDEEGASIDTRKVIIDDAIAVFEANIYGVGLGAFTTARQKRFLRGQETHNLYLEILTELGIQGFILFSAMIISCFSLLFKLVRQAQADLLRLKPIITSLDELDSHKADLKLILATCFAIIGFLVIRLTVGIFGHDLFEIYWWFSIGLTVALMRMMVITARRTDWFIQNLTVDKAAPDDTSIWPAQEYPDFR